MLRTLVIIIAILALIGGWLQLFSGFILLGTGLLMLTLRLPAEILAPAEAQPTQAIGLSFVIIAILTVANGAIGNIFAIGAFLRKPWARWLGIFGYSLGIVVGVVTFLTSSEDEPKATYFVGIPLAMLFVIILTFSKSAFEKPFN